VTFTFGVPTFTPFLSKTIVVFFSGAAVAGVVALAGAGAGVTGTGTTITSFFVSVFSSEQAVIAKGTISDKHTINLFIKDFK
jgi:hypothetical protein